MAKKNLHPKWYSNAKIFCNGEHIITVGATQEILHVDIWSGIHPYYTKSNQILDTEGRVEKFYKKYNNNNSPMKNKPNN